MNRNIEKNTEEIKKIKNKNFRLLTKWTNVIDKADDIDELMADYLLGDTSKTTKIQLLLGSTTKALEEFKISFEKRVKKEKKQES